MALRGSDLVQVEPFRDIPQVFRYWRRVYYGGLEGSVSRLIGTAVNQRGPSCHLYNIFHSGNIFTTTPDSCHNGPLRALGYHRGHHIDTSDLVHQT